MPISAKAKEFLADLAAAGMPPIGTLSVADTRTVFDAATPFGGPPEPLPRVEDLRIPTPNGELPARLYAPESRSPLPVLVYFHGGGWVIGTLETHDAVCRLLAKETGCTVVAIDYRLAPENKFPCAPEDCYAATFWIAENGEAIGVDGTRLAVGGDSAGGNLAAVVSLMARDRGRPKIRYQLLVYPVTDRSYETASYRENAEGYLLTADGMRWFWNHYLRNERDAENPYASPLRAPSLSGLPAAMVVTAELDPLRDEGEAYATKLREAGVPVVAKRYDGIFHGFFTMCGLFEESRQAVREAAAALRAAFA